jgi:uncharacterized protein (TIGR00730 family)
MNKKICVFCSSSDAVSDIYFTIAKNLAEKIAENKDILVYGGSNVGLMRELAVSAKNKNGKVIGVMPKKIQEKGLDCKKLDEFFLTEDMHSRKKKLEEISDAFIALPGGFGTLEELSEVITLKQLEYHQDPIVIMNTNGFYDKLLEFYETMFSQDFSKSEYRKMYFVTDSVEDALYYIENYEKPELISKWYKTNLNLDRK